MLAKALAIFFIVISASPVNGPFCTFDVGDLFNQGAPGRRPMDGIVSASDNKQPEPSDTQPSLPVGVRPLDEFYAAHHLMQAIVPGADAANGLDAMRNTRRGPRRSLQTANTPVVSVLRL